MTLNVERSLCEGKAYERRRARAQDRSRRATNPECFDSAGRFKKGARISVRSKQFYELGADRREANRVRNETKRQQRNALANTVIAQAQSIHLEDLRYASWQAAGMGRSMLSSTPGGLITAIGKAAGKYGRDLVLIDARKAKLSQLCHECGQYHKDPIRGPIESRLSTCDCGRVPMQRDVYSAFLAAYTDAQGTLDVSRARTAWTGRSSGLGFAASSVLTSTRPGDGNDTAALARATGVADLNTGCGLDLFPHAVAGGAGATSVTSVSEAEGVTQTNAIETGQGNGAALTRSMKRRRASAAKSDPAWRTDDTAAMRRSKLSRGGKL